MKSFSSQNYEMELIGCLLKENSLIDCLRVSEEHFHYTRHKGIFRAIMELAKEGKAPNIINILDKIKITQTEYFQIHDSALSVEIFESLEEKIIELYQKRTLQNILHMSQEALKLGKSVDEIMGKIEVGKPIMQEKFDEGVEIGDVLYEVLEGIEEAYKNKSEITGMKTGFIRFDQVLNGIEKGKFVIVGARPGVGKTAFALELAKRLSRENSVVFFSVEMTRKELGERLLSNESSTPMNNVKKGLLREETFERLLKYSDDIRKGRLLINDNGGITIEKLVRLSKSYKRKYGADVIIVDYLSLIKCTTQFRTERERVNYISNELRTLSKILDVAVICLSQLNRNVEGRSTNEPMLSDLRESGNIEQDANVVLFLYEEREEAMDKFAPETLYLKVAKNRGGEITKKPIVLNYYKSTQKIEERH